MPQPFDDHFLLKYRELLDAEDCAFDELEHACEEGDRSHFDEEMAAWQDAVAKKVALLNSVGVRIPVPAATS